MNLQEFISETIRNTVNAAKIEKQIKIEFDLSVLPGGCNKEVIVSCVAQPGLSRIKFNIEV